MNLYVILTLAAIAWILIIMYPLLTITLLIAGVITVIIKAMYQYIMLGRNK